MSIHPRRHETLRKLSEKHHVPIEEIENWYRAEQTTLDKLPPDEIDRLVWFLFCNWFDSDDCGEVVGAP